MPTDRLIPAPLKRKRRWLQFSLRTLMIVVTLAALLCAYVAHEASIVRERLAFAGIAEGLAEDVEVVGPGRLRNGVVLKGVVLCVPGAPEEQNVSWIRRCLGDHFYYSVWLDDATKPEDVERYRALFPEADVRIGDPWKELVRSRRR